MARWGLRGKSLLILVVAGVIACFLAIVMGWYVVNEGRLYSAKTFSESYTELNYQKVLTPMTRELALAQRFADLSSLKAWLKQPSNVAAKATAMADIASFQDAFEDGAVFVASDKDLQYYYYDDLLPVDGHARHYIDKSVPANQWYFLTRQQNSPYDVNIDLNEYLNKTKIWINVRVMMDGEYLGLAGSGFALGKFIEDFATSPQPGVQPFVVNAKTGSIEAHANSSLVSLEGIARQDEGESIYRLVDAGGSLVRLQQAMDAALQSQSVETIKVEIQGEPYVLSLRYMSELNWLIATSVNLAEVRLLNTDMIMGVGIVFALLLLVALIGFGLSVDRLVLHPLRQLQLSAKAISQGAYNTRLPIKFDDEIGDLSRTFNDMAQQVESHTGELESRVKARTQELEQSHAHIQAVNRKIGASIDYASLIQRAILPDRQLQQFLGEHHSVVWRPRDIVGGDFYVFHTNEQGCLLGVVDCAGHGVPGALMTMLMRAAIDKAIHELGIADPAKLLCSIDSTIRSMLHEESVHSSVATNADVGLVYIGNESDTLCFSGAKISLYASDGEKVLRHRGAKRAIGDRKQGQYENSDLPLAGWTYYMTTDGYLDQAGGDKRFGFGSKRFEQLLIDNAQRPLAEQASAFSDALEVYMGDLPQRDDITLLSFRFEQWMNAGGEK